MPLTAIASEGIVGGATFWVAWKTYQVLNASDAANHETVLLLLYRWLAIGATRTWEMTVEPVASWVPFYSELKLVLLLWAAAASPEGAVSMTMRVAKPALRAIDALTRRRLAPVAASLSVAATTRSQQVLAQLLAPALPASELRQWEADLLLQAKALRRAAAALRGRKPSMPVTASDIPMEAVDTSPTPDIPMEAVDTSPTPDRSMEAVDTSPMPDRSMEAVDTSPMPDRSMEAVDTSPMPDRSMGAVDTSPLPDRSMEAVDTSPMPPTTPDARAHGTLATVTRRKARRTLPAVDLGSSLGVNAVSPAGSFLGGSSDEGMEQLSPSLTPMSNLSSTPVVDS